MLNYLDRFSVNLDFDLKEGINKKAFRNSLYSIFNDLKLEVKDESKKALQFFLKYPTPPGERNTIKLELSDKTYQANEYNSQYLTLINRTAVCQTIETMFAHKFVAFKERYEKTGHIAGRDIYDIHYFFMKGYDYNKEVIEERRKISALEYFKELNNFIKKEINRQVLQEDLNSLLEYDRFKWVNKYLKQETLNFIDQEINNLI